MLKLIRKGISSLLVFLMILSLSSVFASSESGGSVWDGVIPPANDATVFNGGNGTEATPYQIATAGQLAQVAANVNTQAVHPTNGAYHRAHYIMTADIDLGDHEWTPIGMLGEDWSSPAATYFYGCFDGGGYAVFNLKVSGGKYSGLFGYLHNATVENLGVIDCDIRGVTAGGITAGVRADVFRGATGVSTIQNCYTTGIISATGAAGGIAGQIMSDSSPITVRNCFSTCDVSGEDSAGGIAGNAHSANKLTIRSCFTTGAISGSGSYVGGIAGDIRLFNHVTLQGCAALGPAISAVEGPGRIAGRDRNDPHVAEIIYYIENNYENSKDLLRNNYAYSGMELSNDGSAPYIVTDSALGYGSGNIHGESVSAAQLLTASFWKNTMQFDPAVWTIKDGELPYLSKEWADMGGMPWQNPFSDVKSGDWFFDDVKYAATNGLFSGTSAEAFSPGTPTTRAMLVTVLYRMGDKYPDTYGITVDSPIDFSDVTSDLWYSKAVYWAGGAGLVSGIGDNKFGPEQSLTRQDLAVILCRYVQTLGIDMPKIREAVVFTDNGKISVYAKEAVDILYQTGIADGKGDNRFDPLGTATRAEVAAMLHRFIQAAEK